VLHGFTVGITADRRWDEQAALFERRNATVVHGPTILTLPLGSDEPLRLATLDVIARPPEVLIANTGLGIRSWFGAADSWDLGPGLLDALRTAKIYARGPKASGAVHSLGLDVEAKAPSERLSEAIDLALDDIRPGTRVALQVDGSGTTTELDRLRALGADVITIPVYEWKIPTDAAPAIRLARLVLANKVQALTFTTGPAIRNWMAMAAEHDLHDELLEALNEGPVVLGIVGPACADTAASCGLRRDRFVIPTAFRLGPLVRAVADQLVAHTKVLTVQSHAVTLSGSGLTVDGTRVELSDIDARLLGELAANPNAVISKADLLARVWADGSTDEHAVEVAIARLRRRLGDLAPAIVSVHRRGYALRT
jgi:uroporphyrinogen-III synthase